MHSLNFSKLALCLAIASLVLAPVTAFAAQTGGGTTCYNCDNFGGSWNCDSMGVFGGTSCTVSQDSCTVSGDCGASGSSINATLSRAVISEIAQADAGAAATLVRLRQSSKIPTEGQVSWHNVQITAQDVQMLLAGGSLQGQTPGSASSHAFTVEPLDASTSVLVLTPGRDSAQHTFTELAIFLERSSSGGQSEATTWIIR